MYPPVWLLVAVALTFTIVARFCVMFVFPNHNAPRRREHTGTCHLAVFLGSGKSFTQSPAPTLRPYVGGHSSEALALVSTLDFSRYTPRTYLVSKGDSLSATKAITLERLKAASEPSLVSAASLRSCLALDLPCPWDLIASRGPYWRISDPHYPPC
jgi:beta-1,4-N-acetylglucosaminyltransferase